MYARGHGQWVTQVLGLLFFTVGCRLWVRATDWTGLYTLCHMLFFTMSSSVELLTLTSQNPNTPNCKAISEWADVLVHKTYVTMYTATRKGKVFLFKFRFMWHFTSQLYETEVHQMSCVSEKIVELCTCALSPHYCVVLRAYNSDRDKCKLHIAWRRM